MKFNGTQFPQKAMFRATVLALITAIVVSACAAGSVAPAGKLGAADMQKRALERSTARWKALTDKRFDDSFSYLSDASKAGITAAEYAGAMQRMGFVAATVNEATCDDTMCVVKSVVTVPIYVRNVGARPQAIPVEEHWIMNNGELWLIRR